MCDPITLSLIGGAIGVAGTGGLEALGTYTAAQAEAEASEFTAKQALNNAKIADIKAEDVERRGAIESSKSELQTKRDIGEQVTAGAAAGVDVGSGVIQGLTAETAQSGAADVTTIQRNAALEAWGFKTQADAFRGEASLAKSKAKTIKRLAPIQAFSTLLSGATSSSASLLALA